MLASGALTGVVVEDAGEGMKVVQFVVGEWMLTPAASPLDDAPLKPDE